MQVTCEVDTESCVVDSLIMQDILNINHFGKSDLIFTDEKNRAIDSCKYIINTFSDSYTSIFMYDKDGVEIGVFKTLKQLQKEKYETGDIL